MIRDSGFPSVPGGGSILDRITERTRIRLAKAKEFLPPYRLKEEAQAVSAARMDGDRWAEPAFVKALAAPGLSFICEVKKASPSGGIIARSFPYLQIAMDYQEAGASAISVLTEPEYFLGSDEYLREIAGAVEIPVLRKDFIIDSYQIYEAVLLGAGAVLLICALLDTRTLADFIALAGDLGLAVLVETHTEDEVRSALDAGAAIIGINNRDLKTFQVNLDTTERLRRLIPPGIISVAESGIREPEDVRILMECGIDALLIGEALMRSADRKRRLGEFRGLW
jgi:indole-3-glycerol phosphate synthase